MREISEKEYQSMQSQNKVSFKQEYEKKKGREVSLDRFLFACYDTSRQLKEIDHRYHEKTFWVGFGEDGFEESSLQDALGEMIQWYKSEFPVLAGPGSMDIGKMAVVAKYLAYFEKDFKTLVKLKSGEHLEDHVLDQHDLNPPWTYLKESLVLAFQNTGEKIWSYFMWAYGISPPAEVVNISEIPPVNRFQRHYRSSSSYGPQHSYARSNASGTRSRGKGAANGNALHPHQRAQGSGGAKKKNKGRSGVTRSREQQGKKGWSRSSADKTKEKEVLALVDRAIQKLEARTNLSEVCLAPQNSFYRRIQHQHAVERGYRSESTGSEKRRAVKLLRKSS